MSRSNATNDVIDTDARSAGPDVPAEMWEKTEQHRDGIARIRVQCKQSDGRGYRFTGRQRGVSPVGSMSTDEICKIALEIARDHAEEHPDEGAKYRAVYDYTHKNGKITPKYAAIRADWTEEGAVSFEDDNEPAWETEREKVLAAANDDLRQQQREAHSLTMESMSAYTESVAKIGAQVENMAKGIAEIGKSLADAMKGTGEAMTQAGALYRESQARTSEHERMQIEARLVDREMDQADKRWDLLTSLTPMAALAVLSKMGVPPEVAGQVVAGMTAQAGGGAPAMPGAPMPGAIGGEAPPAVSALHDTAHRVQAQHDARQVAQAQPVSRPAGWQYPGPLDLDDVPSEDASGAAVSLACWFAERDEHEERAVREIVGGALYDTLRGAPLKGDRAAADALRDFGARVTGLGMQALQLLGQLRSAVGADAIGEFQTLVNRARTGEI